VRDPSDSLDHEKLALQKPMRSSVDRSAGKRAGVSLPSKESNNSVCVQVQIGMSSFANLKPTSFKKLFTRSSETFPVIMSFTCHVIWELYSVCVKLLEQGYTSLIVSLVPLAFENEEPG
jgi:hypothetical protein